MISIDIPNNKINVAVDDATLEARGIKWQPTRITTGYLRRYAAQVTSANTGAVLQPNDK